jgi:starvation-inducible DNA-binding protein
MYDNMKAHGDLAESLAKLLSDVKVFSATAQGYHWNVKGPNFSEYHKFFGKIYEDAESSVDPLAENILKLGFDSPYFLEDFLDLSDLSGQERIIDGNAMAMVQSLYLLNKMVIGCTIRAFEIANMSPETQSIADFLAGRLDAHQKWNWQLGAILNVQ